MTTLIDARRPVAGVPGWAPTLAGLFGSQSGRVPAFADLLGRLQDWNDARLTRRMLQSLSSRQLDDIGLCRGDIESVAHRRA
jgi:uncharacterized protein YjiS (DUF1127 family)